MKFLRYIFITCVGLLTSCKSDTAGDLKIINESSETVFVKFSDNGQDTVIGQIESSSSFVIKIFTVKGNPKKFDCCPCETTVYYIYSSTGKIRKDVANKDNWTIPNKSDLTFMGTEPLRCEFKVTQGDL